MKKENEKPKEIIKLEADYNIIFEEAESLSGIQILYTNNYYLLNEEKKIIGLNFNENNFIAIPILDSFKDLIHLNLSGNQIIKIENLQKLNHLTNLNLSNNQITKIENFQKLNQLKELHLQNNRITKIGGLENLNYLNKLYLRKNRITKIGGLGNLNHLTSLGLSDNQISKIENIENLKQLKNIYLVNNLITEIEGLENLKHLISLDLSNNQITEIERLENLDELKLFHLANNQITEIENLDNLRSLSYLNLSDNQITKIENLENLKHLSYLNLSDNQIIEIENLKQLNYLYLANNQITKIENIQKLDILEFLKINNNPLEKEYDLKLEEGENHLSIIKQKIAEHSLKSKKTIQLPAKVLLLGNHAAGKSSFLHYFSHKELPDPKESDSTHILTIEEYQQGNKPLANFYDFGGQDYYHGIYKAFLTNDSVNLLFWNQNTNKNQTKGTDTNSIGTINFDRNYWLYQLNYFYKKNQNFENKKEETEPILLIQTHADQSSEVRNTSNENTEDLNIKNEFFVSLNKISVEKSKKLQTGLAYLKEEVLEQIDLKSKKEKKPDYEITLIDYIKQYKEEEQKGKTTNPEAILLADLDKHYPAPEEKRREYLGNILGQLCKKGMVLYYPNNPKLKNIVWLNPATVVQFIHNEIFKKEDIIKHKGTVGKSDFDTLFENNSKLIEVLLENKVVYLDKTDIDNQKYIIPGYLPLAETNDYHHFLFDDLQQPNLTLKFEHFIPFGFMNRLICFYGGNPEKKLYWKDQLLFTTHDKKAKALIQLDFEALTIKISVKSSQNDVKTNAVLQNLYFDIIALYWDKEYARKLNKETTSENHFLSNNYEHQRDKIDFLKDETKKIIQENIQDAYLSINSKDFIKYDTLHTEKTSFITSYKLKEGGYELDKANGKSIPIVQFKPFTFNENLKNMKKIFISYSKKDLEMVNVFIDHLSALQRDGKVGTWYCTELLPGDEWDKKIQHHFDEADVICFMVSHNFMKTDYIYDYEVAKAFEQKASKKIVPIILNFCDWETEKYNLGEFIALPYTAKPIKSFKNENEAWVSIVKCIRLLIESNSSNSKEEEDYIQNFMSNPIYKNNQLRHICERIISGKADA